MKGITPVIAVILLLLITVAMVGFAFVWFNEIMVKTTNSTGALINKQIDQMQKTISIENVNSANTAITVRNTGTQTIAGTELVAYVNKSIVGCGAGWSPSSIAPGAVSTCTNGTACSAGVSIKVTGPGNYDEYTC